jgi:hypothetical protein
MANSESGDREAISRRRFVESVVSGCAAASAAGGLPQLSLGAEDRKGPVNCGPPPKPKPQSRSGGESFAPLPLPVTPLRRTEKKRPPAPPALIGKMAMGPIRYMTQEGKRVAYRDWMTDPGDVKSLLDWTNSKLGISYRLVADACCGRLEFDEAFRREIRKVLPDSRLESLAPDHPLYNTHYDIQQVEYTPRTLEDFGAITAPSLEGISLDGRLAVAYSRFDIGNGWEQFPHPFAYGYGEEDALKIGTNLLVYAVTH